MNFVYLFFIVAYIILLIVFVHFLLQMNKAHKRKIDAIDKFRKDIGANLKKNKG